MSTSPTETEFVNAWVDSADQAPSSESIYRVYQQWAQRQVQPQGGTND